MLSKRAKYALNALVELARAREEGPLSASAIAERAHVPGKFLEAILLDLRHAGIIASTRGRTGGHRLSRDPGKVDMASVLRLFDGAIGLVPCVTYTYYERCEECVDEATCGIRDVFAEIRTASVERLKSATLADVLKREQRLARSRTRRRTKKSH
jgi:Rrf2 family protein